ncbi:ATP-binding protein [Azospira restricta]|uniref:histidine kinase n=1 Tax=Azospira restricta TaxID=404405 RepID=A0A974Y594_9RHOO|nr:ATP-binding protein [Azospira restricta]QRJ65190.1 DUF3365 domain-containing protein [Azospira restricta]
MGAVIRSLVVNRVWWLLLWAIYALIAALFLDASLAQIRQHNIEIATEGARNVVRMLVVTRKWNAMHGGVYVPISEQVQPNPYLEHPRRDIETRDGQKLTMINPAFMTRMIADMTRDIGGLSFRIISQKPINPNNAPDAWENAGFAQLAAGRHEIAELVAPGGNGVFRYLAPLHVTKECLDCHRDQGYRVGDLRGGISISQDYAPFLAAAAPSERSSIVAHWSVFLLLVLFSGWALEQLRRSWLRLEDNIAELQQTRDELLQAEKMASLGRMVAGFAHELNTPVGISVGAVSHNEEALRRIDRLLAGDEVDEAQLRDELATLQTGSQLALANLRRASALVQRFKQSSIDQTSEQRRVFAVRELIEDVAFTLKAQLSRKPVELRIECPPELRINSIPGLFEQVLTNLVLNSLQHGFADGGRSGTITVSVGVPARGTLRIVYRDDGAGMAQDVAERIFEPFFTTKRGAGGSGLGMFLCYNIVTEELAGQIRCTAQPGAGVEFDISIPCEIVEGDRKP